MNAFYAQPMAVNQMQSARWELSRLAMAMFILAITGIVELFVFPTDKGLTAVNYVDLEQYLYSVLGSEMNGNWPQEAPYSSRRCSYLRHLQAGKREEWHL